MKNPNGYGSVVKLSGNRRRPYMVRAGVTRYDQRGYPIYQVIGYAATREEGLVMLAQYNHEPWNIDGAKATLGELFSLWQERKAPKLGKGNRTALIYAYKHIRHLERVQYRKLKVFQMQDTIDSCGHGAATERTIKRLWHHLDLCAQELDIISKRNSDLLTTGEEPPSTRRPFTPEEVQKVWDNLGQPGVDAVLILLYSGWRISELLGLKKSDIDLTAGTMTGGTKTKAGKDRVVPIHPRILPLILARMEGPGEYLIGRSATGFRTEEWAPAMSRLGMSHVPHECRHTFRSALDAAGANRKCMDLLMGHASESIGDRVYTHKTLEELRETILLLK